MADTHVSQELTPAGSSPRTASTRIPAPRSTSGSGRSSPSSRRIEIAALYTSTAALLIVIAADLWPSIKFAIVVMWFMHLKFDDRRYARFFVMGLALAVTLYLIVLMLSSGCS